MSVRIGLSGWSYPSWRGQFYPLGLPHAQELAYVASLLGTVEINSSFYRLQSGATYSRWAEQTPADFVFAVKGGRFITHTKRLASVDAPLANFFASGPLALGARLGPILWQLPANLPPDPAGLADFFARLPGTTTAAAELARAHDDRLAEDRVHLRIDEHRLIRHALEVRHPDYAQARVLSPLLDVLREYDIALVVSESAGEWPLLLEVTSDLVYVRLHGNRQLYTSGYGRAGLRRWAERIAEWRGAGLDVLVYFDNDAVGRAPVDALALQRLTSEGGPEDQHPVLFPTELREASAP